MTTTSEVRDLVDEVETLRQELAAAAAAERELPAGVTVDLVRWRCARCAHTGEWTGGGPAGDPHTAAVQEARRHHADHQRWDAERAARREARQRAAEPCPDHGSGEVR